MKRKVEIFKDKELERKNTSLGEGDRKVIKRGGKKWIRITRIREREIDSMCVIERKRWRSKREKNKELKSNENESINAIHIKV